MRCYECGRAIQTRSRSSIPMFQTVDGPATVCGGRCYKRYNDNKEARVYLGQQLILPGIQEEFTVYPKHESDFAPTCPLEWDVKKTPQVAAEMESRYGRVPACVKAETHRKNHPIKSWGWKYWDAVVALLEED